MADQHAARIKELPNQVSAFQQARISSSTFRTYGISPERISWYRSFADPLDAGQALFGHQRFQALRVALHGARRPMEGQSLERVLPLELQGDPDSGEDGGGLRHGPARTIAQPFSSPMRVATTERGPPCSRCSHR